MQSTHRLQAIAEAASYFPFLRGPSGRVEGRHPRAAYWREYSRRRYRDDPAYRQRCIEKNMRWRARQRERRRRLAVPA